MPDDIGRRRYDPYAPARPAAAAPDPEPDQTPDPNPAPDDTAATERPDAPGDDTATAAPDDNRVALPEPLEAMRRVDIAELARNLNIPDYGTKAELVARVRARIRARAATP